MIALLLSACSGSSPAPAHPPTTNSGDSGSATASTTVVHRGTGGVLPTSAGSAAIVPDVGCPSPSCAYHANAAGYFTCLSGGDGVCFHFGAPCTPADRCMFDAGGKAYKQCAKIVEGQCVEWAAQACAPASACMFDPDDGLHHHCDEVAGGGCKKYGGLCAP